MEDGRKTLRRCQGSSWVPRRQGLQGVGTDQRAAALSLPGPGGQDTVALTFPGPGWGRHCEVGRLLRGSPPGPRLGPQLQRRLRRDCAGARRGRARRTRRRGRRPAGRRTKPPFFPPPPLRPSLQATSAPWPGTRGARDGHGTGCLLYIGSPRLGQGQAK
jgi:hypothetical protein